MELIERVKTITGPEERAMQLTNKAVAEALDGLPDYKMHCSVLAEEAIRAAIEISDAPCEAAPVCLAWVDERGVHTPEEMR